MTGANERLGFGLLIAKWGEIRRRVFGEPVYFDAVHREAAKRRPTAASKQQTRDQILAEKKARAKARRAKAR